MAQDRLEHDSDCPASLEIANTSLRLLRRNNPDQAYKLAKDGLECYPESIAIISACSDICRKMNKGEESLAFSKLLLQVHPGCYDGYIKATQSLLHLKKFQEATEFIRRGLELFPEDKWMLYQSLLAHNGTRDYERSRDYGLTLSKLYPRFTAFYRPYCHALVRSGFAQQAFEFIDSLGESELSIEFENLRLDLLLSLRNYSEYRTRLLTSLVNSPEDIKEEIPEKLFHSQHLLFRECDAPQVRRPAGVDIICIASDEAPYIAEFIHHYIYLGFRNFYIGVNNCSDSTIEIIKAIAQDLKHVKHFNVDYIMSTYGQGGCYGYLFNLARAQSDSQYCLIVDIDEFWVASPFPRSIEDFIESAIPFDAYSFHWLACSGEGQFAPPLSCTTIAFNPQVKTICNYDTEYLKLNAHAPIIANIDNPRMLVLSGANRNIRKTTTGYIVLSSRKDYSLSFKTVSPNEAYVFHRVLRSEIEYCCRLFKPFKFTAREKHAMDSSKKEVGFKFNRTGFSEPSPSDASTKFLEAVLPRHEIYSYHLSLESFVRSAAIDQLISTSRSLISEEFVWNALHTVEPEIFKRDALLLRKIFRGTRFHSWIVSRS